MKLEQRYTAAQVAWLALGSGCVTFLIITADNLPWEWRLSRQTAIWTAVSSLLLAVSAVVVMNYALGAFARGVEEELWDKGSLDRIKAFVDKRWWMVPLWLFLLFAMGLLVVDLVTHWPRRHNINPGMTYFWMSPFFALLRIRQMLNPKKPTPRESILAGEMKPLVSDHWGDRGPSVY